MINKFKRKLKKIYSKILERQTLLNNSYNLNSKTFLPYKNIYNGKNEIVICAPGPSLEKYIPIENAIHIGLNRAFLFDRVSFDFIFAQDFDGIKMVQEELINYKKDSCTIFFSKTDGDKAIPESLSLKCNALRFSTDSFIYDSGYDSNFILDIDSRPIGSMPNVGLSVLQLALFMNPSKIYLVGYDMTGTHFNKGNQNDRELAEEKEEMFKYWQSDRSKLLIKWNQFIKFKDKHYPEIEIISINPIGLKGLFKDIYQVKKDIE
jgi:hypothetical protein